MANDLILPAERPDLPNEYTAGLSNNLLQQSLAQKMMAAALQGTPPPTRGVMHWTQALGPALQGALGAYMNSNAQQERADIVGKQQAAIRGDISNLQDLYKPQHYTAPAAGASADAYAAGTSDVTPGPVGGTEQTYNPPPDSTKVAQATTNLALHGAPPDLIKSLSAALEKGDQQQAAYRMMGGAKMPYDTPGSMANAAAVASGGAPAAPGAAPGNAPANAPGVAPGGGGAPSSNIYADKTEQQLSAMEDLPLIGAGAKAELNRREQLGSKVLTEPGWNPVTNAPMGPTQAQYAEGKGAVAGKEAAAKAPWTMTTTEQGGRSVMLPSDIAIDEMRKQRGLPSLIPGALPTGAAPPPQQPALLPKPPTIPAATDAGRAQFNAGAQNFGLNNGVVPPATQAGRNATQVNTLQNELAAEQAKPGGGDPNNIAALNKELSRFGAGAAPTNVQTNAPAPAPAAVGGLGVGLTPREKAAQEEGGKAIVANTVPEIVKSHTDLANTPNIINNTKDVQKLILSGAPMGAGSEVRKTISNWLATSGFITPDVQARLVAGQQVEPKLRTLVVQNLKESAGGQRIFTQEVTALMDAMGKPDIQPEALYNLMGSFAKQARTQVNQHNTQVDTLARTHPEIGDASALKIGALPEDSPSWADAHQQNVDNYMKLYGGGTTGTW